MPFIYVVDDKVCGYSKEIYFLGQDENGEPLKVSNNPVLKGWEYTADIYKQVNGVFYKSDEVPISPEYEKQIMEINIELDKIDKKYRTSRTVANASIGDTQAKARLIEAEELCVPLRKKLTVLKEL